MSRILVRFVTYIRAAGILTFVGTRINQAVHWEALLYDEEKGNYWPPVGALSAPRTRTGKTSLSTNVYTAPIRQPRHRWGTGYKWGEKKWAEEWYVSDHIRVKWND